MRAKTFDWKLQIHESDFGRTNVSPNMSRFLQKLEHCNGENAEILHDHLKQSKLTIKGFGIDPTFFENVTVMISSFTGKLGNWAADHADEVFEIGSIDALTS